MVEVVFIFKRQELIVKDEYIEGKRLCLACYLFLTFFPSPMCAKKG